MKLFLLVVLLASVVTSQQVENGNEEGQSKRVGKAFYELPYMSVGPTFRQGYLR